MRILVTGAAGFVGRHLLAEVRAANPEAQLFGIVRRPPEAPLPGGATPVPGELERPETLRDALRIATPDFVYHLAAHASAGGGDRAAIFRANVSGTGALLTALSEWGRPAALLLASTGYVYGRCDPARPAREEDPLAPIGDYAESKAAMEALLDSAPLPSTLRVVVARAFNHTGPGQTEQYVVPAFARQIARIEAGLQPPVIAVGELESRRDFTDARDVARAYRLALDRGEHRERFNVCSGAAVSAREVLDRLLALSSATPEVRPDPNRRRASDLPVSVGSPRKLEDRTGWRRARALNETLQDVLAEWRTRSRA
jgi:GDP-4-dehydro-6-deoxy-D-mannose reductase